MYAVHIIGFHSAPCLAQAARFPVQRDLTWVYRYSSFAIWLFSTILIILDRIYWNVWPRQTICTDGCGNDFYCDMDEVMAVFRWDVYGGRIERQHIRTNMRGRSGQKLLDRNIRKGANNSSR